MRKSNGIRINYEYQRAPRWTPFQQKHLIDSVLRGYRLPLFYFHLKTEHWGTKPRHHYEVIDGQQRINAFVDFADGVFALPDPKDPKSRFPRFIQDQPQPCPWANSRYSDLDSHHKQILMRHFLNVIEITSDDELEVRDLFLRLQSGTPLTPQERRDAFPGAFTQFIVDLGGRTEVDISGNIAVKGGHWLFRDIVKMNTPARAAVARRLAAIMSMQIFSSRHQDSLKPTNNPAIDDFYYQQLDFDPNGDDAQLIIKTLDDIHEHMVGFDGAPIKQHELLCMAVMWPKFRERFVNGWQASMPKALSEFKKQTEVSRKSWREGKPNEMYIDYMAHTSGRGSDSAAKNELRSQYFENWMIDYIKPKFKDPVRRFDNDLRERLYSEHDGICAYASDVEICGDTSPMPFAQSEVHHVNPHSKGGPTKVENAVLTHRQCNQKIGDRFIPPPRWN